MSSIVPGYEYDIFISYRHNDNRSGWVTEFVRHLSEELAATIKEPVSVYFDSNPHDGLLETHNVDKSLEGKLKCIIFIPILSQTYCDPKSFAWQHEFCAFIKMTKDDGLGGDIRLDTGNVTSRILPVKIHDLDIEDKSAIEREINSPLRAIDFIYREAGVNRPLKVDDKKEDHLSKTSYRNQLNKVANAVKEILSTQHPKKSPPVERNGNQIVPPRHKQAWKIWASVIIVTAVLAAYFIFYRDPVPQSVENTILVLPFKTDQADASQVYFAEGITADIITEIGKAANLSPLSWHTSFEYADTKKSLHEVAEETKARYVLSGSIQKDAGNLRIRVELADPYSNKTLWGSRYDKEPTAILDIQKEIAFSVAEALEVRLSDADRKSIGRYKTKSFEAYDLFLQAEAMSRKLTLDPSAFARGQELLEKALAIDPNFAEAYTLYAFNIIEVSTFADLDGIEMGKKAEDAILKAITLNPELPDNYIVLGAVNFYLKWNLKEAKENFEKGWAMAGQGSSVIYHCFCAFSQFKIVKGEFAEALGFIDTVQRRDPRYPYAGLERFLAYQGLGNKPGMQTIRETGQPEFLMPAYDYLLGDYVRSANGFSKGRPFLVLAHRASAYFKAGLKEKSDSLLTSILNQPDSAPHRDISLAMIYGSRGEKQDAVKWFMKAFESRNYVVLYIRTIPDLNIIIDEPEVRAAISAIGL